MDAKERILQTATELLLEKPVIDQIKVREIAERAGVGVGLINYHFKSKDALLKEAYDRMFLLRINEWLDDTRSGDKDPLTRLRMLVRTGADISLANVSIMQMGLAYELTRGGMDLSLMILPLLRGISQGRRDELTLRLISVALITTLQSILVKKDAFEAYMGINLQDSGQRDKLLDLLIDQLVFCNVGERE